MSKIKPHDVVIVDCARSAITPAHHGQFQQLHPEQLGARLLASLLQRHTFDLNDIDGLILGCAYPEQQQSQNIARRIGLLTQLPVEVPAHCISAFTGSSMQALHHATAQIMAAQAQVFLLGGLEHVRPKTSETLACNEASKFYPSMAQHSAYSHDLLAKMYDISKEEQDEMAFASHQKVQLAQQRGLFKSQIIALEGQLSDGTASICTEDTYTHTDLALSDIKQDTPISELPHASFSLGNSALPASGASGMLVMSQHYAQQCGLKVRAVIRANTVASCDPAISPFALVSATQKALNKANMTAKDIQQFEIHEASASQYLTAIRALDISKQQDCINSYGGAIALGDASGATGLQLITSLLHAMEQHDRQFGLTSLAMPLGQGMCTIIERI